MGKLFSFSLNSIYLGAFIYIFRLVCSMNSFYFKKQTRQQNNKFLIESN